MKLLKYFKDPIGWFAILIKQWILVNKDNKIPNGWSCIENKTELFSNLILNKQYIKQLIELLILGFKKFKFKTSFDLTKEILK